MASSWLVPCTPALSKRGRCPVPSVVAAALGLPSSLSAGRSLAVVCRLLIEVASHAAEHRLEGMWASVVTGPGL